MQPSYLILPSPRYIRPVPRLAIGRFSLKEDRWETLVQVPLKQLSRDFWGIALDDARLGLEVGKTYCYWFGVWNNAPEGPRREWVYVTDPFAGKVNSEVTADRLPFPAVKKGFLGTEITIGKGFSIQQRNSNALRHSARVPNNRLVIYELPTRWAKNEEELGVGTFDDIRHLMPYLTQLGVNALELLPVAHSPQKFRWGYGTAHYFAPDADLGGADKFRMLAHACHENGLRIFHDAVMAFALHNSLRYINYARFFVHWGVRHPLQRRRQGFGGDLWNFTFSKGFGTKDYLLNYLKHWMHDYGISGLRLDSINNIDSPQFVHLVKDETRRYWQELGGDLHEFLVVGEDLGVPDFWLKEKRLDGLWNEPFKHILRRILTEQVALHDLEEEVKKIIDCRRLGAGFSDLAQAVIYITSHDVEGEGNERLYDFLRLYRVSHLKERIQLAFFLLLTCVGIPMIFAGEEFADRHDFSQNDYRTKQLDALNFERLEDEWRHSLFQYVSQLVHLRTTSNALCVNDNYFLYSDFSDDKRVMCWLRGTSEEQLLIVVNLSDYKGPWDFPFSLWPESKWSHISRTIQLEPWSGQYF